MKIQLLLCVVFTCCSANFFSYYVQNYLNHEIRPCDDFFAHVCSAAPPEEHFPMKMPKKMLEILMKHPTSHCKETLALIQAADFIKPEVFPTEEARKSRIQKTCSSDLSRCRKMVELQRSKSTANMSEDEIAAEIFQLTLDYQDDSALYTMKGLSLNVKQLCRVEGTYEGALPLVRIAEKQAAKLVIKLKEILISRFENTKWMQKIGKVEEYQKLVENIARIKFLNESFLPFTKKVSTEANECMKQMFGWHSGEIYTCIGAAYKRALVELRIEEGYQFYGLFMAPMLLNGRYDEEANTIDIPAFVALQSITGGAVELGVTGNILAHELSHAIFAKADTSGDSLQIENFDCIKKHREEICRQVNYTCYMGEKTIWEDAADIAGLDALLDLSHEEKDNLSGNPPDLSKDQFLFYTIAASLCTHELDHDPKDPHSPNKGRVNALLMHSETFQNSFSCKDGDRMWRKPDNFCHLLGPDASRFKANYEK